MVDEDQVQDAEEQVIADLIAYSADELIDLREAALSQKWPPYLDEGFKNNRGTWDPDRWHQNKRRGSTPPAEDKGPSKSSEAGTIEPIKVNIS